MTTERTVSSFISPLMQTVAQDIFLFLYSLCFFGFTLSLSLSLIFCVGHLFWFCVMQIFTSSLKHIQNSLELIKKPPNYFSQVCINLTFSIINSSSHPNLVLVSSSTIFWFHAICSPKFFCHPSASLIKPHILANISPTL